MPVPQLWKWAFAIVFLTFAFLYFINALAPETSPDGSAYHIPIAARYYRAHGFERVTWNMYFNLSQGVELLFVMAFAFGRHSATALTHFSFLLALPFLMVSYARRYGFAAAGTAAALIVFVSPVVGLDGSCAYIDVALTAVVFGMYYFLQLWDSDGDWRLLIPAGLLAGFAFAAKYTAFVAVAYALLFIAWSTHRRKRPMLQPIALLATLAFVMIAPWLIKNWLFVHNPFAPFANNLFRNPYFHISAEQYYRDFLTTYDLKSRWQIPLELTIRGERLSGLYGPAFLLTPLTLLGLRNRTGRLLLLTALVLGSTYFTNIGARLLMPVIPFVALALVLVFQKSRTVLFGLTLAQAILCWPWVLKTYCSRYAWRLDTIPISAAFRTLPEETYMMLNWPPYFVDRMLDTYTKPADKVFAFSAIPEAYTSRQILVQAEGARNDVLTDILTTALVRDFQPRNIVDFHFAERQIRRLRVVETARLPNDQWDISELRVLNKEREVARDPAWRLRANPNPWDVQLAFDNSQVTRWRTWQVAEPGMFIEIDFGGSPAVDGIRLETSDYDTVKMRVEGADPSGRWTLLTDQAVWTTRPVTQQLRRAATEEIRRRGVRHVLINSADYRADDFFQYSTHWGMREIARAYTSRLFLIE